ncbi:hypothetical protein PFISCL1PPCAC_4069, partial [Pristionchus fissidentatus]
AHLSMLLLSSIFAFLHAATACLPMDPVGEELPPVKPPPYRNTPCGGLPLVLPLPPSAPRLQNSEMGQPTTNGDVQSFDCVGELKSANQANDVSGYVFKC